MTTTTALYRTVKVTLIPPTPVEPCQRVEISVPSGQAVDANNTVMIILSPKPELRIVSLPQGPGCFTAFETASLADLFFVAARVMGKVGFGYKVTTAEALIQ